MQSIQGTIRQEVNDLVYNSVRVVEGYSFNQYETIKRIHLYMNSQFYSPTNSSSPFATDNNGADRIFFNITLPRVRAVARFFDIDVKDVRLDEIEPQSEMAIHLLNKEFERFANEVNFSEDLNDMIMPLVTYGTVVLKVLDGGKPEIVPLKDIFCDPKAKSLKDSRFVTIKHVLTPTQLREKVKQGWDAEAVEAVIERSGRSASAETYEDDGKDVGTTSSKLIEVYERYGYTPKWMIEGGDSEEEIMSLAIVAEPFDIVVDEHQDGTTTTHDMGQCLFKSKWTKDVPVIDHHLVKTEGRWMGIGIPELLFDTQQRMNEVANQKRISMQISALHLFQTADPTVLNNILSDLENGDVIKTKNQGALTPIVNEERNLPAFNSEMVTYSSQADKLTFANDLLMGGDVPSSTPATNVVVQNNNQVLVHLQDRERFANFVSDKYIKTFLVPELLKNVKDEHFLRIVGEPDDILQINEKLIALKFRDEVIKRAIEGSVVDVLAGEDLREEIAKEVNTKSANRYVKVLQGYYEERIGDIVVHIDNEKKDMAKVAGNTLQYFQMVQNPAVLDDPVGRLFVTNYGREIGIDTASLELAFARRQALQQQGVPQEAAQTVKIPPQKQEQDPQLAEVL